MYLVHNVAVSHELSIEACRYFNRYAALTILSIHVLSIMYPLNANETVTESTTGAIISPTTVQSPNKTVTTVLKYTPICHIQSSPSILSIELIENVLVISNINFVSRKFDFHNSKFYIYNSTAMTWLIVVTFIFTTFELRISYFITWNIYML